METKPAAARPCGEHEITVAKLLRIVHRYTERIKIYVVPRTEDFTAEKARAFYITEDFARDQAEIDRVLKYYADVPVWNLHVSVDPAWNVSREDAGRGTFMVASIVANCYYRDARDGYLREKEDRKKEKARLRRERNTKARKERTTSATPRLKPGACIIKP